MKRQIRTILILLLLAVFLSSVTVVIVRSVNAGRAADEYGQAQELRKKTVPQTSPSPSAEPTPVPSAAPTDAPPDSPAPEPTAEPVPPELPVCEPDEYTEALVGLDLSELTVENPDVKAWILIPGTVIDYPVVQGEDNDYYLEYTWMRTKNSVGSIVLECHNSADFGDFSTIIYGHLMRNDSMFGTLKYYANEAYFSEHPQIYLASEQGVWRYSIFAVYETPLRSATYYIEFPDDAHKQEFIDYALGRSVIQSGIVPGTDDRFLTLSTCIGSGYSKRWVVQAVLDGFFPNE